MHLATNAVVLLAAILACISLSIHVYRQIIAPWRSRYIRSRFWIDYVKADVVHGVET